MHSDSAISVRKLSVNPNAYRAMKVATTDSGSVRPVITVLRQLCRNRNTISTVRSAPSTNRLLDAIHALLDRIGGRIDDLDLDARGQPRP